MLLAELSNTDLTIAASTIWVIVTAVLVMFMQAGFAFLEAGLTRMKNAGHIAGKNVLIFAICSIVYWAVGFGLAFGDGGLFIGTHGFFPSVNELTAVGKAPFDWFSEIPGAAGYMFEVVFAGVSLAIVWGAMAERAKLWVYFAFGVWFTITYSIVSHWIWSPHGWLFLGKLTDGVGMQDFAGSTVVHYQGALAGLAGALILGPRIGKFGKDGRANPIPGHNIPFAVLGTIILWFGWFGFNPGSTLSVDFGGVGFFAEVALITNIAAAAGAVTGHGHRLAEARQAGHLDDAERRARRPGRDHRGLGLRRSVGCHRDRRRLRLHRGLRRDLRREDRHRRPDRRGRRARHVRCLGHARLRPLHRAGAREEPRHRPGRPRLHGLVQAARGAGASAS